MKKKILFSSSVFIAGLCSIVYELLISTTATYFLGNGVKQFSIIIGVYLFSMGIGAYISKYFTTRPLFFFIKIEYVLGFIGGISVPLIYFLFVSISPMALQMFCLLIVALIGILTGMEVPLLTFAHDDSNFKDNLSNVLSLDYLGGLIATLLFPFILLPFIGLFYSSLLFGILNILLGISLNFIYYKKFKRHILIGVLLMGGLIFLVFNTGKILKIWEEKIYRQPIVYNQQTPYQKIVLTKKEKDVRLYLDRIIQFSSLDEHRYHESLIHIPLMLHKNPERILILGGGENLASREVLKHVEVKEIDVVDIDSMMFHLAKTNRHILEINKNASLNPIVSLIADDAFNFLYTSKDQYDIIIADLPDPSNEALAKLYSRQFFLLIKKNLKPDGIFVTQAGEIYFANTVFSCIHHTVSSVFGQVKAYHSYIPSFGDWGFIMASEQDLDTTQKKPLPDDLKFLNKAQASQCFVFPKDVEVVEAKLNSIDNPVILKYYLDDWERWKQDLSGNAAN